MKLHRQAVEPSLFQVVTRLFRIILALCQLGVEIAVGRCDRTVVSDLAETRKQELDKLRDHGIGLIQLHGEWCDNLGLFGGNHFTPQNPAGFRRFVDMVHRRGMKLIVYISDDGFDRIPHLRRFDGSGDTVLMKQGSGINPVW